MPYSKFKRYWHAKSLRYLYSKHGDEFVSRFALFNRFYLKWPISICFVKESSIYKIQDHTGESIFIAHQNMAGRYKMGIRERLAYLADEYMTASCDLEVGDILIDVGANVGELSSFLRNDYSVRVIAFEPEKKEFQCLKLNNDSKSAVLINEALWTHETTITLYHKANSNDSSLIEPSEYDYTSDVSVIPLDLIWERKETVKLLENNTIKLLKLEAEGAEPEILSGATKTLGRTRFVAVDCGPERGQDNEDVFMPVYRRLSAHGFEIEGYYHKRGIFLFENKRLDP